MADKPRHPSKKRAWVETLVSSEIRDWVQTLAIVLGVGAGIYQFLFKEIIWPNAAPINLTTEVTVKEVGFSIAGGSGSREPSEAIEIAVTAKNPSALDVYLLGNCWYARGLKIRTPEENGDWLTAINGPMRPDKETGEISGHELGHGGAYYAVEESRVVAANAVFTDYALHPNETISNSFVIFVPQNRYDVLQVVVQLPTTAVQNEVAVARTVRDKDYKMSPCDPQYFRRPSGILEKIANFFGKRKGNFEKAKQDDFISDSKLKYQVSKSTRELSLWPSKPTAAAR